MKILMIDLGREYGGSEKVVENLLNAEYKNEIELHLACLKDTKLSLNLLKNNNKKYILLDNDKKRIFKTILILYKYIKINHIKIIHCHGVVSEIIGVLVAKLTGCKIITTIHSRADFDTTNKRKGKIYCLIQRYLSIFNEKYIVVSKELEKFFLNEQKIKKEKIIHIDNGIKALEFTRINNARDNDIFTICSIGRLTAVKAHEKLILALALLHKEKINFKCLVAGEGELEEYLKSLCKDNEIEDKVEFLGFTNDVRSVFDKSDCLIMQSDMEGLPIVLLEAMSYRLPIIAHRVGGIANLLNDVNSIVLKNNNEKEIAKKIEFSYYNKEVLRNNAQKAFTLFKSKYDLDIFIKEYEKVYLNI